MKKEKFESELSETIDIPCIFTGLALTSVGGDILFIEATRIDGNGQLTVTGQLDDEMKQSAQIDHRYVRSKARYLEIDPAVFRDSDVHLHVPAGSFQLQQTFFNPKLTVFTYHIAFKAFPFYCPRNAL